MTVDRNAAIQAKILANASEREKPILEAHFKKKAEWEARPSMEGQEAPEFMLPLLDSKDGGAEVSLSSFRGRPLGLIFGSYTCPAFQSVGADLEAVHQKYKDRGIDFLFVYPSEAHPTDGWVMQSNIDKGICYAKPKTLQEKMHLAAMARDTYNLTMPMLVDRLEDKVDDQYGGMPIRLYALDKNGVVVYQGPLGPFGLSVKVWEDSLQKLLV